MWNNNPITITRTSKCGKYKLFYELERIRPMSDPRADKNCSSCRGKGYYFIKEDDMEICECTEREDENICDTAAPYPECNNAEGCSTCEHEREE